MCVCACAESKRKEHKIHAGTTRLSPGLAEQSLLAHHKGMTVWRRRRKRRRPYFSFLTLSEGEFTVGILANTPLCFAHMICLLSSAPLGRFGEFLARIAYVMLALVGGNHFINTTFSKLIKEMVDPNDLSTATEI